MLELERNSRTGLHDGETLAKRLLLTLRTRHLILPKVSGSRRRQLQSSPTRFRRIRLPNDGGTVSSLHGGRALNNSRRNIYVHIFFTRRGGEYSGTPCTYLFQIRFRLIPVDFYDGTNLVVVSAIPHRTQQVAYTHLFPSRHSFFSLSIVPNLRRKVRDENARRNGFDIVFVEKRHVENSGVKN